MEGGGTVGTVDGSDGRGWGKPAAEVWRRFRGLDAENGSVGDETAGLVVVVVASGRVWKDADTVRGGGAGGRDGSGWAREGGGGWSAICAKEKNSRRTGTAGTR